MGYRIASTKEFHKDLLNMGFSAPNIDSYFKNLKLGIKASGQIHYMFWDNYGIGIDYQFHQSSGNIIGNIDQGDGVTLVHGEIKNQVYTNFTGLSLYSHYILNNNRVKLYYQISMGLTMYREETTFIYSPMLISGKAFGGNTELGFEYFLTKNFSLGINANLFQSTISNIKVDNGIHYEKIELEKEQQEGLSRLDIGIGIKIYL
jgi:hypothetical protein